MWKVGLFALLLAASAASAAAMPTSSERSGFCAELGRIASMLTALRDVNPAAGVARGRSVIATLRRGPEQCPADEAMLLTAVGSNLHILGRNREALELHREALGLLAGHGSAAQRAIAHRAAGVAYTDIDAHDVALDHYLLSLSASEEGGDALESAKTAGNIGNLYNALGQLEQSRDYHERALSGFERAGSGIGVAGTLINLGALAARLAEVAADEGNIEEARLHNEALRDYNLGAAERFSELGNKRGVAYASSNLGLAYDRLGQPEMSLRHHERSLVARREIGDVHGVINSLVTMASALSRQGRHAEAAALLDEADAAIPGDSRTLAMVIAAERAALAEAQGDFEAALRWQQTVMRLQVEAGDADYQTRVAELQLRFDADRQARRIELLNTSAEVAALQLQRQQMTIRVGIVIAILLAALIVLLYSRYRVGLATARALERAARSDPLTGLSNRRDLLERLDREVQRVRRSARPFAVVMADLDNFKPINDQHGHDVGDAVLKGVAERLAGELREQDTLARWGGEEFLVLLPETGLDGASQVADKLRHALAAQPLHIGGLEFPITLTLGISQYLPGMSVAACIKAADEALYRGKAAGKDRVVRAVDGGPHDRPGSSLPLASSSPG